MYYNEHTMLFLNGEWKKASDAAGDLYSQTLHYGNGVFEGIRSYDTPNGPQIFKAREHYERLIHSANRINVEIPYTVDELVSVSYELLKKNGLKNAYIRPLIFMGANMSLTQTSEVHLLITCWQWAKYLGDELVKVMISSYQRPNPKAVPVDAKITGHYTNSILATTEAKSKGFDEALLLDANGYVAEGPGANFFMEKDGVLITPDLGNILPGITRDTIIKYGRELGFPVEVRKILPEEINDADAAFFTGTAAEVAGIMSIGGIEFPMAWEDSMGHSLLLMYRHRVSENEVKDFTLV
jgi:branched-chain amino acid aminotransferase